MERKIADERTGLTEPGIVPKDEHAVPCAPSEVKGTTYEGGKNAYEASKEGHLAYERSKCSQELGVFLENGYATSRDPSYNDRVSPPPEGTYTPEQRAEDNRRQREAERKDRDWRREGERKGEREERGREQIVREELAAARRWQGEAGRQTAERAHRSWQQAAAETPAPERNGPVRTR